MKQNKLFWIVSFFGVGAAPKAQGTFGTLAAIPFWIALQNLELSTYLLFLVAFIFFAIFICDKYETLKGSHDSSEIVIDEVAGFWVTMAGLPSHWIWILAGFVLFRIFDIFKPGPIGMIDRKMKKGAGVVLDDIAAGLISNWILHIVYNALKEWGLW